MPAFARIAPEVAGWVRRSSAISLARACDAEIPDLPDVPRGRNDRRPMIFRLVGGFVWLRRAVDALLRRRTTVYVGDRVGEYRRLWSHAAAAIGAEFIPLSDDVWEIRLDGRRTRIANDLVEFDDPVTLGLAGDKTFCYDLADSLGIPTPDPRTFDRPELADASRTIALDDGPLVVKPARGTGSGVGVTVSVTSRLGLTGAIALAAVHSDRVIVERLVAAETVRLLFLDGAMIHAVRRAGVRIHGDGESTVSRLLADAPGGSIDLDDVVARTLRQQAVDTEQVLGSGQTVVVRWLPAGTDSSHELRTIYDEEVTTVVGPGLIGELEPLIRRLGTRFAGVDVLTNDPSRPLVETGGVFLEVNTTPGMHHHCPPSDEPCPVACTVLRRLLEPVPR